MLLDNIWSRQSVAFCIFNSVIYCIWNCLELFLITVNYNYFYSLKKENSNVKNPGN